MPLPDLTDNNLLLPDAKAVPNSENKPDIPPKPLDFISYPEAVAAAVKNKTDLRPRIFDKKTNQWILIDTGSQCSVTKAQPDDVLRPDLLLEAVDGSRLQCFGTKPLSIRLNRKEYHIDTVISNTTDTILGMDFLDKYGFEFRRGQFGDLFLYDPKAQISTLCQFTDNQEEKESLPRIASLKLASVVDSHEPPSPVSSSLDLFGVAAITESDASESKAIPPKYKALLDKYPPSSCIPFLVESPSLSSSYFLILKQQ